MSLEGSKKTIKKSRSSESGISSSSISSTDVPSTFPIIVHNLDASIEESLLYDYFKKVGPVISTLVVRKYKSSLGYGYVNFRYEKDALCAVKDLDQTYIKDNLIKVRTSKNNRPVSNIRKTKLHVYNIDPAITKAQFEESFSCFGEIISSQLIEKNESSSYGHVEFKNPEVAEQALLNMNETTLKNSTIKVCYYNSFSSSPRTKHDECDNGSLVTVRGFSKETTTQQIEVLFASCGHILACEIIKDPAIYCIVTFRTPHQAKNAIESFNNFQLNGNTLYVEFDPCLNKSNYGNLPRAGFKEEPEASRDNLYVCNFSKNVKEDQLRALFRAYGEISSVKILKDSNDQSRGCGFIKFDRPEDASKALALNGRFFGNKILKVQYHIKRSNISFNSARKNYVSSSTEKDKNLTTINSDCFVDPKIGSVTDKCSSRQEKFISSVLSSKPSIQKQMLRDFMSFKIQERLIQHIDAVTDMFLDNDISLLLDLVQDSSYLNSNIDEAIQILLQFNIDNQKKSI